MNKARRNHNYVIDAVTLEDGRVRAKARGRKKTQRTAPKGTTIETAVLGVATLIEGERLDSIQCTLDLGGDGTVWAVFVTNTPKGN